MTVTEKKFGLTTLDCNVFGTLNNIIIAFHN